MSVPRSLRSVGIDVSPLRQSRDFRLLWSGQLVSVFGRQISAVAIPLQVYLLTGSTFAVGLVGVARLLPLIFTSLIAGVLADRFDRRLILLGSNVALAGCSTSLALLALTHRPSVWAVVGIATAITVFSSLDQPARASTIPNVVTREALPSAMALNLGLFHLSNVGGPVAGGVVIASFGLSTAYAIDAATYGVGVISVLFLSRQRPNRVITESPLRSLRSGFSFIRAKQVILGSFVFDLDAMIFGLPRALFPVLALHLYHGGAVALGLLYAAPSIGGVAAIVTAGWLRNARRLGRTFMLGELVWGLSIAVAGFSPVLWPVLVLLAIAGGADAAGVVCRSTIMQLETPDVLRGRVSSAYAIVVGGGPYLGDFEAGTVATLATPEVSFVAGGVLCAAFALVLIPLFPQLWRFDRQVEEAEADPAIADGC